MTTPSLDDHASLITNAPIFKESGRLERARLLSGMKEVNLDAGAYVCRVGDSADHLYLIAYGSFQRGEAKPQKEGFLGEECAVGCETYLSDVKALEPCRLLSFSRDAVAEFCSMSSKAKMAFYQHLLAQESQGPLSWKKITKEKTDEEDSWQTAVGWIMVLVLPVIVFNFLQGHELDSRAVNFLTIFTATTVMWVFRLVPEFIPAVFLVMTSLILGVVPSKTVLSGFASGSFFMALSVFGIGSVLVRSGLTYRLALRLLQKTPKSRLGYEAMMLLVGMLLTPILPSANGRVSLVSPLLKDVCKSIKYKTGGVAATGLAASAFAGVSLFSAMFLTSKSINFAVYDLFPAQVQYQFTWGYWTLAAAVPLLVMLVGHFLCSAIFFRSDEQPHLDHKLLGTEISMLGKMSREEWLALGGIVLFFLGVLTSSMHKIAPPWIGLAVLYLLLSVGALSKKSLRRDINWPFLLMLAGMISIVKIMNALALDQTLSSHLGWLGVFMRENPSMFLLPLSVCIFLLRLIVPNNANIILMCSLLLPIADNQGMNVWVVAFIILFISDAWFFPHQSSFYLAFQEETRKNKKPFYESKRFLSYNASLAIIRVLTIFVSLRYWEMIGLI